MSYTLKQISGIAVAVAVLLIGCGGQSSDQNSEAADADKKAELTDFEMEHGIGPVDEAITIDEIDEKLVDQGEQVFDMKCSACHKMDSRYVGPPLGGITNTRTPAYLMNMILNPAEMIERHPIPKGLLGEYATRMTDQHLSREEARAVVEYLADQTRKQ